MSISLKAYLLGCGAAAIFAAVPVVAIAAHGPSPAQVANRLAVEAL